MKKFDALKELSATDLLMRFALIMSGTFAEFAQYVKDIMTAIATTVVLVEWLNI